MTDNRTDQDANRAKPTADPAVAFELWKFIETKRNSWGADRAWFIRGYIDCLKATAGIDASQDGQAAPE